MTRALQLLTLLLAGWASAQPVVTRGGALKKRAYQTYATTTLYVDPTGSNSNACTASGTDACATLAGAFGKLPRFIRNNVTINVAAGTYAMTTLGPGINIDQGVTLAVTGALANITPATGSASGTLTAVTATGATGPATITDSGQTWTVNDLKGSYITFTSGTLSGQSFPIQSNTATAVRVATLSTVSPSAGNTYTIQRPSVLFTGTGTSTITGITGEGALTFTALDFFRTTSAYALTVTNVPARMSLVNVTMRGPGGAIITSARVSVTRSYVYATTISGLFVAAITTTGTIRSSVASTTGSYLRVAGTSGAALNVTVASENAFSNGTFIVDVEAANLIGIQLGSSASNIQMPSTYVYCSTASGTVGIGTPTITDTQGPSFVSGTSNGNTIIDGCGTGFVINGRSYWSLTTPFTVLNATTGIKVERGGHIYFYGSTPTFTTVTNELDMDGTAYPFSFLTGLTPQVMTNSYGSTFSRLRKIMTNRLRILLVILLLAAGFAFSQATLGPVVKLGESTSANLPTPSASLRGGLIWNLDAGAVWVTDGVNPWAALGGSSSGSFYWYDAGTISSGQVIQANVTGLTLNSTTSANGLVEIRAEHPSSSEQGKFVFYGDSSTSTPVLFLSGNGGNPQVTMNTATSSGAVLTVAKNLSSVGIQVTGDAYVASASSTTAFQMDTAGAKFNLAGASGPNFTASSTVITASTALRVGSYADAGLPTATAGTFAYNTSQNAPVWADGTNWNTMSRESVYSAYVPAVTLASVIVQSARMQSPGGVRRINSTTLIVGTGGGDVTYEVYNGTTASVICTRTMPCASAVGGVNSAGCTGGYATADDLQIRVDNSACATPPAFNVAIVLTGGG